SPIVKPTQRKLFAGTFAVTFSSAKPAPLKVVSATKLDTVAKRKSPRASQSLRNRIPSSDEGETRPGSWYASFFV
ncbi:unnamed protein product, partial [Linum tenue]